MRITTVTSPNLPGQNLTQESQDNVPQGAPDVGATGGAASLAATDAPGGAQSASKKEEVDNAMDVTESSIKQEPPERKEEEEMEKGEITGGNGSD